MLREVGGGGSLLPLFKVRDMKQSSQAVHLKCLDFSLRVGQQSPRFAPVQQDGLDQGLVWLKFVSEADIPAVISTYSLAH